MSIGRFMKDFKYDFCVSPQGFDYHTMTAKEAEEHFNWFLENIDGRIEYLKAFCGIDLDFSYESLIRLWEWFLKKARVEKIPHRKLKALREQYTAFGDDFVGKHQLSVSTEYLVRDIGIYLSEVFKRTSANIQWGFSTELKSYFFVNRPMLMGFVDKKYAPPFSCECDPIHLTRIQAVKLLDHSDSIYDLYNVAMKWKENIE